MPTAGEKRRKTIIASAAGRESTDNGKSLKKSRSFFILEGVLLVELHVEARVGGKLLAEPRGSQCEGGRKA